MDTELKGKTALVFAASKGLGRAAAYSLAAEGCRVAICARNEESLKKTARDLAKETGAEIYHDTVDVEHAAEIETFIEAVRKKWGTIDILVNNAGGPPVKTFEETKPQEWEKYFRITFMSVVTAIHAVLPVMKTNRSGRIINITSISVKEPIPGLIYSNSLRMAVVGMSKTLSREIGPFGITINNVAPGFFSTDGLERIVKKRVESGEKREQIFTAWEESVPLRKIGDPAELAALITFLASVRSGYMTGTTIQVDGGRYSGAM